MRVLDAATTRSALPFPALIAALRQRFAEGAEVPRRLVLNPDAGMTSLVMPAWVPGGAYAVKIVNIAPGNAARGLPGLHASVLLHDGVTGQPFALMDGDVITARRTAAASALAASFLTPPDASSLLVVGAGRVAELLPEAYAAVRPLRAVQVWTRRPDAAQALATQWRAQGLDATAVTDLPGACAQADIVSCATLATAPVVHGAWLQPGAHLDLIGSFTPAMREADDDAFRGAALYVDTDEALDKSGELLEPMARGVFTRADVRGTLASLCRGEATPPGRGQRTVFKSVGTALEDLAAAMLVQQALGLR